MKLYLTPLSHFSRKVRVVTEHYKLNVEYVEVGPVTEIGAEKFADNPLMSVPVLSDGEMSIMDSDHIVSYLVRKNDPYDKLKFEIRNVEGFNLRAVLNGLMSNEVKVIQGLRSGIPIDDFPYFKKAKASMEASLLWLEKRSTQFNPTELNFDSIHLVCAIDHIKYFQTLPLDPYPKINQLVESMNSYSEIRKTSPFLLKPISTHVLQPN